MSKKPRMPAGLKQAGKATWRRLWENKNIEVEDYETIVLLCKLLDERAELDSHFNEHPRVIIINNNTNIVLHPYVKRIGEIDKILQTLFSDLGLSPKARKALQQEVEGEDPFKTLQKAWEAKGKQTNGE